MRLNRKFYCGTIKHPPAAPDFNIDIYSCSDEAMDKVIEARRAEFIDEWFKYEKGFYD